MKVIRVVGGLGSQMMAYALGIAIREKNKRETIIVDFSAYHSGQRFDHNGSELKRVFGLNEDSVGFLLSNLLYSNDLTLRIIRSIVRRSKIVKCINAIDKKYNFDNRVFDSGRWRLVEIHQCWTSYKYFQGVEDLVRQAFVFPETFICEKNNEIGQLISNSNSISIHVRRGDYVGNKTLGGLITLNYYKKAIEIILNNVRDPHFFVFSDDPLYVKENIIPLLAGKQFQIIDSNKGVDSWIDMALMSKCSHHIIPNSGFGWWGAYLGSHDKQVVVAPKYWANSISDVELRDMSLPHWTVLNNC